MERVHIHRQLNITYPEKEVFFRLGGNIHKTGISAEQKLFFDTNAAKAFAICRPQGRWMIKKIVSRTENSLVLNDGKIIESKKFSELATGAEYIWFSAVTVGNDVVSFRDGLKDISAAAIYDAVAGETADIAMDMVHKMSAAELLRRGLFLSKQRYSPGYGDLSLEHQKLFFELLDMADMGLTLTDNCFMIPEKSVTALAAVMPQNN